MGLYPNGTAEGIDVPKHLAEQLAFQASVIPDRIAIFYQKQRITYKQLNQIVNGLAGKLLQNRVKPGDRILIAMERRPEVVVAYLAVARVAAIAVPLNFKGSKQETISVRQLTKPVGTLYHSDLAPFIGVLDKNEWTISFDSELEQNQFQGCDMEFSIPVQNPEDIVYLNFTSGSTGQPKAAIATHSNLYYNTKASCDALDITGQDVHLPLFSVMMHPHEIFCRALLTGGSIVLIEHLYPRAIAQAISDHGVTCIMAVPPVYKLLLPFADNKNMQFDSIRVPESGGMATTNALRESFLSAFKVPMVPVWGSTETMGIAFASQVGGVTPPGSVGRILPYYEASIRNSTGQESKPGETGELWIRGPAIMSGYWDAAEETSKVFSDGWYCTGDLFDCDVDGNFYCRGRKDSMLKVSGQKVYPGEIEAVLFLHPYVRDAVVIPYNDRLRGVVPLAAVVIEPGETLTETQLREFVRDRLARYKIPRVIRFLPEMPRTSGGKIDRRWLVSGSAISTDVTEKSLHQRIESIDLKILHLLNERLKLIMEVTGAESEKGFRPEQLQETLKRLKEFNPGPMHDSMVERIFNLILSIPQYL